MSKQKHNDLSKEQQHLAISLYSEERWSARKVAGHLQVNHSQIYNLLRKNNVSFHRQPDATERLCKRCWEMKKIEEFPLQGSRKRQLRKYHCRTCHNATSRDRNDKYVLANYGLTEADYESLFKEQDGVCAICKQPCSKGRLSVDHDHRTGKVRGLLCRQHNVGLGNFQDNVEHLKQAIKYLQET